MNKADVNIRVQFVVCLFAFFINIGLYFSEQLPKNSIAGLYGSYMSGF